MDYGLQNTNGIYGFPQSNSQILPKTETLSHKISSQCLSPMQGMAFKIPYLYGAHPVTKPKHANELSNPVVLSIKSMHCLWLLLHSAVLKIQKILITLTKRGLIHIQGGEIPCNLWSKGLQRLLLSTGWGDPCKVDEDDIFISKERN